MAIGETPFCLVYGNEAIILAEIEEETTRVSQYNQQKNAQGRSFNLSVIEEGRDRAYAKILRYKSMMTKSYNPRVKPRNFQVGDLVLKKVEVSKHVENSTPYEKVLTKLQKSRRREHMHYKIWMAQTYLRLGMCTT
ncbi:UNVERIFIED_CONTAM: hypothetical protein Sindi_0052100 [Sesamum indicum]